MQHLFEAPEILTPFAGKMYLFRKMITGRRMRLCAGCRRKIGVPSGYHVLGLVEEGVCKSCGNHKMRPAKTKTKRRR